MMPIMRGLELCHRLKSDSATRALPVIVMGAAWLPNQAKDAADACLSKPFDLNTLLALVADYVGAPRPRTSNDG